MKDKFVVTIGRMYGSGGREIGMALAELLDIPYYDKKLIAEAARRSGLSSEVFEQKDEQAPNTLMYALSLGFGFTKGFSPESIFAIQSEVIRDIANQEACVIVGRCADYVLRDNPRCINIFIHSPEQECLQRIMDRNNIGLKEATERMEKTNKVRTAYYEFYTGNKWGCSSTYHLSIDSSKLGVRKTAQYIKEFIDKTLSPEN